MCGICGVFGQNNKEEEIIHVKNMMKKLVHRGPDDKGLFADEVATLGFVRLSIVDLQNGEQPMFNEDKSIVTVCNGEIYNYKELRKDLEKQGHVFYTQCDVEVLPHLYEEEGIDFVKKLNGQFAIAVYDTKSKEIFLARDQVGIAPLFYTKAGDKFIFASEIKAILEYPGIEKEIDLTALDQMLSFPGIIAPRTMFKGIQSIENGHFVKISREGLQSFEYWDLDYSRVEEGKSEEYYVQMLREALEKAVQYRLNASVPVGYYVSGGLDSSVIAGLIHSLGKDTMRHSFSVDFMQKEISEQKYQRMVLQAFNSWHHERVFGIEDIVSNLKDVIYHSESPLKETYNTASYVLSQLVQENSIKVVLTGEGADELFGGYVGYKFDKMRMQMGDKRNQELSTADQEINQFLWGDAMYTYEKNHGAFNMEKLKLFAPAIAAEYASFSCTNKSIIHTDKLKHMDLLQKRSYLDFKMRLSDHLLSDHGDRMAYAHSVEARYPFLDANVVEVASRIPSSYKLNGYNEKYIVKKVGENLVPTQILKRPKFAFVAPGSPDVLKTGNEYIQDLLSYETIKRQGIFDPNYVEQLKVQYSNPDFKLSLPFDSDMLIIVITTGILLDVFKVKGKVWG